MKKYKMSKEMVNEIKKNRWWLNNYRNLGEGIKTTTIKLWGKQMKQISIVIGLIVSVMIVSMTIMALEENSSRETELNRAVAAAVKQTVKASCGKNKEINSNDDMINFCMNNIAYNVSGTSDYEIEVMSVDYKEGMLDIIVTEKYTNVVGKEKKITIRKAAIYG